MNGIVFVIFGYTWCVAQISSATKQHKANEGIGFPAVNLKEGVSAIEIYSRNRRDNSKEEASYIFFDNRSDRVVELWWMDKSKGKNNKFSKELWPGETIDINTYNTHQWSVIEKYTRKSLLINNEKVFSPQSNEPSMRTILIIRRSEQIDTKLPEKFIEAMVVVDKSVIELLGNKENVTRYILTLLRMSTKVLQHQSLTKLGVKLTHVLSKLVLLHEDVNEIKFDPDDGESTFLSICSYMDQIESKSSVIFDQKIFLTKRIFGKAGYSYGKGMCRRGTNCALIFNDGFSSPLNIAHETGHALGMDDQRFPQGSPFVMSSIIFSRFNNYDWSRSSQISLLKNIRLKHCLDNKPLMYNKDFPFVHTYPGVHYSILKQCHLKYNMNYSTWPYQKDQCKWLTCRMPPPWSTQANRDDSQPLDGTKCGTNKWCLSGVCQRRTEPIVLPTAIHGDWGEWKAWKPCSRTCGTGISTRERECNNPLPLYGGNFCVGIAADVRVCSTGKNCSDLPKQEVLCSETGAKTDGKRQWGIYDEAKVNLDCNFESDANAWCNWSNEIHSAQQDWKLNKGKTRSSHTGPSVDHTTNTHQGQYLYFESSSPESKRGYKARLSSSKLAVRQACLSFWYHMFGNREMGTLRVIQKSQGASKTLWNRTGNQGQTWLQAKVEILDDNLYQIFFEAEKVFSGYHSDIALDDITFTPGGCDKASLRLLVTDTREQCVIRCKTIDNKMPQRILFDVPIHDGIRCGDKGSEGICYRGKCTKVGCDGFVDSGKKFDNCNVCGGDGSSCKSNAILEAKRRDKSALDLDLDCDFNNDLCKWNIVKSNANDLGWSRKTEKYYNQGHYLYMGTSSSQRKGKLKAKIVSLEVFASKACLSFDYKMNGNKPGELKVKLLTKPRKFASLRCFKEESPGNRWRKAKILIKKDVPYKVVLEAVVKNHHDGNVAIDNVQFRRQNC